MSEISNVLSIPIVDESQLPSIISEQMDKLKEVEENINHAENTALEAKQKAENAKVSAGFFKKKQAIELLQDAAQGIAEAQISATDAQKFLFEYQKELTKITKYLFGLGVSSISANRVIVKELELKLQGASDGEISELAKQELISIVKQLKAQEDVYNRLDSLTENCKDHEKRIKKNSSDITNNNNTLSGKIKECRIYNKSIETKFREKLDEDKKEQNKRICDINGRLNSIDSRLKTLEAIQKSAENKISSIDTELGDIKKDCDETVKNVVSSLSEDMNKRVSVLQSSFENSKEKLGEISDKIKNTDESLNKILSTDCDKAAERMEHNSLDKIFSSKIWKISVSAAALASLVLNVLQIIGVL